MRSSGECRVEIIATGDELMYGRIVDTNSNWIAKRVAELGGSLRRVTMIGDEPDLIGTVLHEALNRNTHYIIFTGGLGPSEDDLTVESIGNAVGKGINKDPITAQKIRDVYKQRGLTDHNSIARGERMARIIEDSDAMQNPVGFSVGMKFRYKGKTVFTLPGVPSEMKGMFDLHIAPMIEEKATSKFVAKTVNVTMVWKEFFPLYRQLQHEHPDIYIKNAATPPVQGSDRSKIHTIKVDIVVEDTTVEEATEKMEVFLEEYRKRIDEAGGGTLTIIR